ncbi:MAG: anti-sigma factor family protein [Desulfocucumaceae bacterium]
MRCHEAQELMSEYTDGVLDPSDQERVDRHIEGCPECRSELDALKMVVDLVRDLPLVEPPQEFRPELRKRLETEAVRPQNTGLVHRLASGRWSGIIALAASFVLVIGLAATWEGLPWKNDTAGTRVESYAVKESAQDQSYSGPDETGIAPEDLTKSRQSKALGQVAFDMTIAEERPKSTVVTSDYAPAASPERAAATEADPGSVQVRKLAAGNGASGVAARGTAALPPPSEAEQPRQAVLEVKVEDMDRAVREISGIAQKLGGTASVLPAAEGREVVLSIPAGQFDQAVADISRTGRVTIKEDKLQAAPRPDAAAPGILGVQQAGKGGSVSGPPPVPGTVIPAGTDPGSGVKIEKPSAAEVAPMSTIVVRLN